MQWLDDVDGKMFKTIELNYFNQKYWKGNFEFDQESLQSSSYRYVICENDKPIQYGFSDNKKVRLDVLGHKEMTLIDDWDTCKLSCSIFRSKPFSEILLKTNRKFFLTPSSNWITHYFQLETMPLSSEKVICILGSGNFFNHWSEEAPHLLHFNNNTWSISFDLRKETLPIYYKYAIYDTQLKKVMAYEPNEDRVIENLNGSKGLQLFNQWADFSQQAWRGTGVNIPLTAIRTESSWGVGDFTSLYLLTDWCKKVGISMMQLLPVNDTSSSFTNSDSYPYAAISSYALHPIFIDVVELANKLNIALTLEDDKASKTLNDLEVIDYEKVVHLKLKVVKECFKKDGGAFLKEQSFQVFFANQEYWLKPYAVFCLLRDRFNDANYHQWGRYANYSHEMIAALTSEMSGELDPINFYYFIQYYLHLQFSRVVRYIHDAGIVLKGDLPIGVHRNSVETWMNPSLFSMKMQAGAPPDDFAIKGQNWGFPSYNRERMKATNFDWWQQRLKYLSEYFDAIRIDHVLGLFRIWTIPVQSIEGVMGYFDPVKCMKIEDFESAGLIFDRLRLCEPFINDEILIRIFGDHTSWVKKTFIEDGKLKALFNTQKKIENYFVSNPSKVDQKEKLFNLISNIILLVDEENDNHFHFRINMKETLSYQYLNNQDQRILDQLYEAYFYARQYALWFDEAKLKLDVIQQSTDMMICAEDLGMVPDGVEAVLASRGILSLQVQRMPKKNNELFSSPSQAPYLSVVTPSTHDMSPIRMWWKESGSDIQRFYSEILLLSGKAPFEADAFVCKQIIMQHLQSPALWAVFLIQDLLAIDEATKRSDPAAERINDPTSSKHIWNYRMHVTMEMLLKQETLITSLRSMIQESNRSYNTHES